MSFERWLAGVDHVIGSMTGGLTHRDIADQTWHDWYDDELSPHEAAEMAFSNEFEGGAW
ncbi:hypothetical protein SEA_JABITH_96 [Mycobacterium phage Jabith]|nr:hypothetical protein SEA_JABITH_96 [Mycobacterium phage Jabith]